MNKVYFVYAEFGGDMYDEQPEFLGFFSTKEKALAKFNEAKQTTLDNGWEIEKENKTSICFARYESYYILSLIEKDVQ